MPHSDDQSNADTKADTKLKDFLPRHLQRAVDPELEVTVLMASRSLTELTGSRSFCAALKYHR